MNKNLTKKALVPAIAMVLASVIALSGVTYAWFTTGTTATVGNLDVNVQTANGIQVSLDAASWKSAITADDIKDAIINANSYSGRLIQLPEGEIAPVSSAGNIVDGKLEMFYGEYTKSGNLRSVQEIEQSGTTKGNFIAFDLFFKSTMKQTLSLKRGQNESYVNCVALTEGANTNVGTDKAVRVAFLNLGSAATADAARVLKGENGKALIWEPNSTERATGVEGSGKVNYSGFAKEFEEVAEDALGDNVEAVTTFDSDAAIVELQEGINKIRVYIWLEGQDVDCINNISFGDFSVNLAFTVPEAK